MAKHNIIGKAGEEEAANYLQAHGFTIRHRNWHAGKKELDIVAMEGKVLVVVEVKCRSDLRFGAPELAVDDKKIRCIVGAADAYVRKFALDNPIRFDIVSVVGSGEEAQIDHIRDAFYPPIWNY
jgi:putative endonuclease